MPRYVSAGFNKKLALAHEAAPTENRVKKTWF